MCEQDNGEWLDKEPRPDGKPRRWRPFEIIAVDPSKIFNPKKNQRLLGDTPPRDRTSK